MCDAKCLFRSCGSTVQQCLTLSFSVHNHNVSASWSEGMWNHSTHHNTSNHRQLFTQRERERESVNRIKEHISSYRWKCTPAKTLLFVSEISQITGCKLSLLWSHIEAWGASSGLQYYLKLGPETLVAHQHPVIAQLQPIWARCEIWSVKFKYTIAWYF